MFVTSDPSLIWEQRSNDITGTRRASGQRAEGDTVVYASGRRGCPLASMMHKLFEKQYCRSDLKRRSLGVFEQRRPNRNNKNNNSDM